MSTHDTEIVRARNERPALNFQIGDHPAFDFLNTTANLNGRQVEWLETGEDLLEWMVSMKAIDVTTAEMFSDPAQKKKLGAALKEIVQLREWFRNLIESIKAGGETVLAPDQLAELNKYLSRIKRVARVVERDGALTLRDRKIVHAPKDMAGIAAEWIADLLSAYAVSLMKMCESDDCSLWFYDLTKSHRRRWCSPSMCGNREKVAAHRARKRGVEKR